MRLIIREYLSMLRESEELDALLPDLLLSMDIKPTSKPQRGVRQYGVDLAATGVDPEDGVEKMYIFVIKQKDIDRNSWDSGPQSVRQTLNEIVDVYFETMLNNHQRLMPKKVVLCTNGDMKQDVLVNWTNYTRVHGADGLIEFDFWGGDRLSSLVNKYLFDEFLFPAPVQAYMRKTLVFVELVEYNLSHFYQLIDEMLAGIPMLSQNKRVKALRCLHLCLNVVFHWSNECCNLKHAVHAAERLVLRLWDCARQNDYFNSEGFFTEFMKIDITRREINHRYLRKIAPHCMVRDGLFGYGSDEIEYPLRTFEQIGIVSVIGLDFVFDCDILSGQGQATYQSEQADSVASILISLIRNNKSSNNPLYDSHINDICLALLLLYKTGHHEVMKRWIHDLFLYMVRRYQLRHRFPLLSESFDQLIDLELGNDIVAAKSSTLIPLLLEWTIVLNSPDLYADIRNAVMEVFDEFDLQYWLPDSHTEQILYAGNALYESVVMLTSIVLPETLREYRDQFIYELHNEENPQIYSFVTHHNLVIGAIAFRHFRTPVFPFYWRNLIEQESNVRGPSTGNMGQRST